MKSVPDIISTKDLTYLSDIFYLNLNASKKALSFCENIQDSFLKDMAHDIALMHANICRQVIAILERECYE